LAQLTSIIQEFYQRYAVQSPGIAPQALAEFIASP
jgi:hypothetical protein